MRFIATADWQLGMTARFLDGQARPRFLQARLDAVRRIGELAGDRGAQFVVVCGDVFESNQLDRAIISRAFEVLRGFPVPVHLLPGNHDPLDAASLYDSATFAARTPEAVRVLREPGVREVAPGVQLVAAPWFSKRPDQDLVARACAGLEPTPAGTIRIVAGHGAVSSLDPDAADPAAIDDAALRGLLDAGIAHVAVLGDRHSTTQVDPRIWYPGTPEVTDRAETDPGNVLVIDVDPATGDVTVEPVRVGRWAFTVVEQTLNAAEDVAALERRLAAIGAKERTAVWLRLSGTLTMADNARLERLLEEDRELFARLDLWERYRDLAVLPDGHDFADLHLGGFADQAVDELAGMAGAAAESDTDAESAQGALRLLYRLAGAAGGRS